MAWLTSSPGKASAAFSVAKSQAWAAWSQTRRESKAPGPKASITRREATPLPQPKSKTVRQGGVQPLSFSSRRTWSHFQPILSA